MRGLAVAERHAGSSVREPRSAQGNRLILWEDLRGTKSVRISPRATVSVRGHAACGRSRLTRVRHAAEADVCRRAVLRLRRARRRAIPVAVLRRAQVRPALELLTKGRTRSRGPTARLNGPLEP